MKRFLFLWIVPLCLARALNAQPELLTAPPDAHAAAMGFSGVSENADANSIYWNAAKLAFADYHYGASASYQPFELFYEDGNFAGLAGYYRPDSNSAVAVSGRYFSTGTVYYWPTAYHPIEKAVDVAYAHKLFHSLSASVTARLANLDPDGFPGRRVKNYFAADAGVYYEGKSRSYATGTLQFSAGMTLANIGPKPDYNEYWEGPLPLTLRPGAALSFSPAKKHRFTAQAQLNAGLPKWERYANVGGGLQYEYANLVAIRAGYSYSNFWSRKLTCGIGLHYRQFQLDAAYTVGSYGFPNDGEWFFTLSANFNSAKK